MEPLGQDAMIDVPRTPKNRKGMAGRLPAIPAERRD